MVSTKLTYADYLALPGDERYELHDGELVMVASPSEPHQRVAKRLAWQMMTLEERGLGQIYFAPFDVVLSDTEVVQSDLLFVSQERSHIITQANVQGAPDLVVEILSPSTANRDWTYKREYVCQIQREGVMVSRPRGHGIGWVMLLQGDAFELEGVYSDGQSFGSSTLEGFTIDLDDVF